MAWAKSLDELEADARVREQQAVPRIPRIGVRAAKLWWAALALAALPSLWWVWSMPGAVAVFALIGAAFPLWRFTRGRGAWVCVAILGLGLSGVLTWQAFTGEHCPAAGTKVFLKEDRPPIGCSDVRQSAAVMAIFFGLVGFAGLAAPFYTRHRPAA